MWWKKIEWKARGQYDYPTNKPLTGQPVVIVGGGPSMTAKHIKALQSARHVILVNNSTFNWTYPCPVVALDRRWWGWHGELVRAAGHLPISATRPGVSLPVKFHVHCFEKMGETHFTEDPLFLTGKNSGHAAVNFAVHLGSSRIYLAGFDMGFVNGKSHYHQGHRIPASEANYVQRFRPSLERMTEDLYRRGVYVSAITPTQADIPTTPFRIALEDLT